jgi:hypothetical protein
MPGSICGTWPALYVLLSLIFSLSTSPARNSNQGQIAGQFEKMVAHMERLTSSRASTTSIPPIRPCILIQTRRVPVYFRRQQIRRQEATRAVLIAEVISDAPYKEIQVDMEQNSITMEVVYTLWR